MAAVLPVAPRTVAGIILPGWMARDHALQVLTNECVEPRLDGNQAAELWEQYRRRVEESPVRDVTAPQRLALSQDERREAQAFLQRARQQGMANILDVIKFDPRRCVIWQLQVITERSETYSQNMGTPENRLRHCLGSHAAPSGPLPVASAMNDVRIKVPHAEWMFTHLNPGGFRVLEAAKHITVTAYDERLLLFAGYHRSFAVMTREYPEGMDRSLISVLTTDGDAVLSTASPNQGVREMLRGLRPPLFEDFLDERFCIRVRLRKRRCELWIQGQIKWFDDDT